ncbi:hypothetical protein P3T76_003714 [Phytophthora citrophthora]|uniref:Uncharacterized protein n=1 Tax=Phytophthora citrophthora TaxID=4793 RepID=A0AAD9GW56_9STRA|nr:hypothetical protein P3T76_003714 [Phytophthora citrophthora]
MASTSKELPSEGKEQAQDTEIEMEAAATHEEKQHEEMQLHTEQEEKQKQKKEEENEKQKPMTPSKPAQSVTKNTPSQTTSATKRKFDALHARNAAADPSISEHETNKKARASTLMKTPGTKVNRSNKTGTKVREFSFARPTESSANRTAAAAKDHARAKPTPLAARKPIHPKRTLNKPQRASVPARTAPARKEKEARPHFNYTPYSGPLPPLTVESSFAPKGSQNLDHGPRTASPAKTKLAAIGRNPRPASAKKTKPQSSTGKENNGVRSDEVAATNATSSSKRSQTPVKSSKSGPTVSGEQNGSALNEKVKSQCSVEQQDGRSSPISTTAAIVDPTS